MTLKQVGFALIRLSDGFPVRKVRRLPYRVKVKGEIKGDISTVYQELGDPPSHRMVKHLRVQPPSPKAKSGTRTLTFNGTDLIEDPNYILDDLTTLKREAKEQVRQDADGQVSSTNWATHRKLDQTSFSIPNAIKNFRDSVWDHIDTLDAEINALVTAEDVSNWESHSWPEWSS